MITNMTKNYLINKHVFKEHPIQLSSLQIQGFSSSKLHQCALIWSDKCAHCEIGYDELKQKLLSSDNPTDDNLNELNKEIEESLATLEGFNFLFDWNKCYSISCFNLF